VKIEELLSAKVVQLMAGVDFDKRYYAYFEACRHRPSESMLCKVDFSAAMGAAQWPFRYSRSEDFFHYFEERDGIGTGLNVAFTHGDMELILVVTVSGMHVGGTFHGLAHDIAERRDPNFAYNPPYPRIPLTNHDELADAVRFAVELFDDARTAIVQYPGWDAMVAVAAGQGPSDGQNGF
jgi:hypothetical protein